MRVLGFHSLDFWCSCCRTTVRGKKKRELEFGHPESQFASRAEVIRRVARNLSIPELPAFVFLQDPKRDSDLASPVRIRRWELKYISPSTPPHF